MRLLSSLLALVAVAAPLAAQPATVVLVRHAERATAPASDPILTEAGTARAQALKVALANAGVSAVITTHLQRTQLTARPLADSLGLTIQAIRVGGPIEAHLDSVAAAVRRQPRGATVLVVGHSNTVPGIIAALGGPRLPDLCDGQYASLFVLQLGDGTAVRLVRASYGAADPADADACARTMRR
jgi:broad specificity phosphatase PhoE